MRRTGVANLPLHGGGMPRWLFSRMKELSREISLVIISEFGLPELLKRLSDPFWFQAFGCVLGFDWHSSGVTTTVCGALKEGLADLQTDLGLFIAGGKGKRSRETPDEIEKAGEQSFISTDTAKKLVYASRMSAKVDNNALQDGYQIYHHTFIFTKEGDWTVVQQGMNVDNKQARRYHWLGEKVEDFVNEPHSAICCDHIGKALNMVAKESEGARNVSAKLVRESLNTTLTDLKKLKTLQMPAHHLIEIPDFDIKRLEQIIRKAHERKPKNFEALLGLEGVGPKTIRALALISQLIYGTPLSWRDPVKFAFAHGGKDGTPYPVDKQIYDQSVEILRDAISKAKITPREKLKAIRRLMG